MQKIGIDTPFSDNNRNCECKNFSSDSFPYSISPLIYGFSSTDSKNGNFPKKNSSLVLYKQYSEKINPSFYSVTWYLSSSIDINFLITSSQPWNPSPQCQGTSMMVGNWFQRYNNEEEILELKIIFYFYFFFSSFLMIIGKKVSYFIQQRAMPPQSLLLFHSSTLWRERKETLQIERIRERERKRERER